VIGDNTTKGKIVIGDNTTKGKTVIWDNITKVKLNVRLCIVLRSPYQLRRHRLQQFASPLPARYRVVSCVLRKIPFYTRCCWERL